MNSKNAQECIEKASKHSLQLARAKDVVEPGQEDSGEKNHLKNKTSQSI